MTTGSGGRSLQLPASAALSEDVAEKYLVNAAAGNVPPSPNCESRPTSPWQPSPGLPPLPATGQPSPLQSAMQPSTPSAFASQLEEEARGRENSFRL